LEGEVRDRQNFFPREYVERQNEHPVKFLGENMWAFQNIVVQVINPQEAKTDYDLSSKVDSFVSNYLLKSHSHQILDRLLPIDEYIRVSDEFMAEALGSSPPDDMNEWLKRSFLLLGVGVQMKTKDEQEKVLINRNAVRVMTNASFEALSEVQWKDPESKAWASKMFHLYKEFDFNNSMAAFDFPIQNKLGDEY
jgi:hypothetical protein